MRRFLRLCAVLTGLGLAPALADGVVESTVWQLRQQGFVGVDVASTLLGRVKITADRGKGRREIIINPRTGEILRDLWVTDGVIGLAPAIIPEILLGSDGKGRGSSGSDDDSSGSGSGGDDSGGDDSGGDDSGGDDSGSDSSGSGKDGGGSDSGGSSDD